MDNVNRLSQLRYKHDKKDVYNLYDWIVYKQGSKVKEKERKGKGETGSNVRSYIQSLGHVRVM